tara:strand:- start:19432 stop:20250 length:819 start_codon:yes stop_codon:yes gene_type:complete
MASEFEQALLTIEYMSYEEKMEFARELKENHENIEGHLAHECVFCKPLYDMDMVCDLCLRRESSRDYIYGMDNCGVCDVPFHSCYKCNDRKICTVCHDDVGCNTPYCRNCLATWCVRWIQTDENDCKGYDNIYYDTATYKHPKFTYDELMQLGEALRKDHTKHDFHIVKDCIWCCGSNPDQKICDYCFSPLLSTSMYRDEAEYQLDCFTCKEKFMVCYGCCGEYECDDCDEKCKRYCQKCLISMPLDIYCEKHDDVFTNPFWHECMTKACKE